VELVFSFREEFLLFLQKWPQHATSIAFSGVVWLSIVTHLFYTGHAKLGKNGKSNDIGCGDIRVYRFLVIFGGPAGLSFGIPYYYAITSPIFHLVMLKIPFGLGPLLQEYWIGFIYIQFATSVAQTIIFLLYALLGKRSKNKWRFFKAHLKGCGWVSALSPIGWIFYLFQQFFSNRTKILMWLPRDAETLVVFVVSLPQVLLICLVGSLFNQRLIIPIITWIDKDHADDEDSSSHPTWLEQQNQSVRAISENIH
jgi:hypothetical protein